MHRIVSLLPSATEIVCALGFESQLIGRSHECDYPAAVARLPALTEPKFNPERPSAEIDREVRRIVGEALSVYRVDAQKLRELAPDVIVTQSQCEVCAVSERDVEDAVGNWLGGRPQIVSLAPYGLADIFADIERVARALGEPARGAELVGRLMARMDAVAARARRVASRPTLACIEWLDPLMSAGNWMPEMVEMAAGHNLFGTRGRAFGMARIRRAARRRSRRHPGRTVRLQHAAHDGGTARAGRARRMDLDARGARGPGVRRRGQPVFQPAGTADRRVTGNPRRDTPSRAVPIRPRGQRLASRRVGCRIARAGAHAFGLR